MTPAAPNLAAIPPPARTLAEKIAAVMGHLNRVPKNGRNAFHGYDYATEGDVADTVREALAAEGVACIPSVEEFQTKEGTTAKGAPQVIATVKVKYTITDGHEVLSAIFFGMAADNAPGDKALYKALTGAHKYFMLKTFSISTGDDEDPEREPDAPPRKPQPRPARPPESERQDHGDRQAAAKESKANAVDLARQARRAALWKRAENGGMTKEKFQAWVTAALNGEEKPSASWTDSDLTLLETLLSDHLGRR